MTPPTSGQVRRFEELFDQLANVSAGERERALAAETDSRVVQLLRLASWWADPATDEFTGRTLGGITLVERLGQGGMGVTYRGIQQLPSGPRAVAVKFVRPDVLARGPATASAYLEAFEKEVALLQSLSHPGIVVIFAGDRDLLRAQWPKVPWIAMELLVASTPLIAEPATPEADQNARLLPDVAAKLACFHHVCDAVAHAHARGVLHLDLTPANVRLLPGGQAKVIDFGLGAVFHALRPNQPELVGRGTLPYRAPEQFDPSHGPVGKATDVHALGVLLYQLLTGRLPYPITNTTGDDASELENLICHAERLPLPTALIRQKPGLAAVLKQALNTKSDARSSLLPDAGALREACLEATDQSTASKMRPGRSIETKVYNENVTVQINQH